MRHFYYWAFVLLLLSLPQSSFAKTKTLFEGYYKISSAGRHIGYYIQRFELETKKKQFISTYFLRTNQLGGNISESLKAYSTDKLNPVSYNYTSLQGTVAKTIDANVREGKKGNSILQVKVNENGKLRVYETRLEKGTFFSTFLIYLLLQGEKGITPGVKYNFRAVAEEDGKAFPGEVFIESEAKKMNLDVFKILYTFKNTQFVNFIDLKGESLISISPALNISAELVSQPALATAGMKFNKKNIKLLFGNIPSGNINTLNSSNAKPAVKPASTSTLVPKAEGKKEQ